MLHTKILMQSWDGLTAPQLLEVIESAFGALNKRVGNGNDDLDNALSVAETALDNLGAEVGHALSDRETNRREIPAPPLVRGLVRMTAPFIEPVTEGNPELASLLLSDTPLTAEQWDYIEACELAAGDDQ